MSNVTEFVYYSVPLRIIKPVVFGILSILVIGGNTLCLVVLKRHHNNFKTTTRLFLTSLTCADLLTGLLYIFPLFIVSLLDDAIPWSVTRNICFATRVTFMLSSIISIMSLLCVNIDRYIAIEYPLRCEIIFTARRARIAIACIWTLSLMATVAGYFALLKKSDYDSELCNAFYDLDTNTIETLVMSVLAGAMMPIAITIVIYARIIVIVNRHKKMENKFGVGRLPASSPRNRFADSKALNTFLLVTAISCSTWIPVCVFTIYNYINHGVFTNSIIDLLVLTIALCTFWINILIYTCRDRSFRKGALELLRPTR